FDGTAASLENWNQAGPGSFELGDDCTIKSVGGMGLLWYDEQFGAYSLKLDWKMAGDDNSGVFVRFPDPGNDPWVAVNEGYEIQICDSAGQNSTGAIYNAKPATELATRPIGEWHTMEDTVVGQSITAMLNGKVVTECTGDRKTQRGFIGLQNHDDKTKVSFRNVKIKPIEKKAE